MPSEDTEENDITGSIDESTETEQNSLLLRRTKHEADVHIKNTWESQYNEVKVGVESDRELAYVFQDVLDWEESHHRWNSDRVEDTKMWEIDLSSLFYVACAFLDEDAEVTIEKEVWIEYHSLYDS